MKKVFLKGSLTKLSGALIALVQTPNLIGTFNKSVEAFSEAASTGIDIVTLAGAMGVIYGAVRAKLGYFEKGLPRLKLAYKDQQD